METPFEKYFRIQNDPDTWNDPSFSIEEHGKGFALYRGRNIAVHGYNIAHITECDKETRDMITAAMNAKYAGCTGCNEASSKKTPSGSLKCTQCSRNSTDNYKPREY